MESAMEPLERIVEKMEAPLLFASQDGYRRLPRIRNLGEVMISLVRILIDHLEKKPNAMADEMGRLSRALLALFDGYDGRSPLDKKARLAEGAGHVSALKAMARNLRVKPGNERTASTQQEGEGRAVLSRPIESLHGLGPRTAALLARKNLTTIQDLLYFLPRRYEDRRTVCRISETAPGIKATVTGKVIAANMRFPGRRRIFEATIDDGHGALKAIWFKGREAFLRGAFQPGKRVILTGEVSGFPFEREMIHPDFEILDDHEDQLLHFKRIVPIYSETEGLHQKTLRRIMWRAVRDYARALQNPLPEPICRKHRLKQTGEAIRQVHFPEPDQDIGLYQDHSSDAHRTLI